MSFGITDKIMPCVLLELLVCLGVYVSITGRPLMDPFAHIDAELARIATGGYFLALRVRGSAPLMAFNTYPKPWVDHYMANGYVLRDPITTWSMTVGGTIRWSSPYLLDPFRVLKQAARHGLKYGVSVAHGPLGSLTICSAARPDREFTDDEIAAMRAIVIGLHDHTAPPKALTADQQAILAAMAAEQTAEATATTLGIPVTAARTRYRQFCADLFAHSPTEAVQRARTYKLL
jgi:LuxR family transcriptional regulator, quorum-sensing system regulator SdiA